MPHPAGGGSPDEPPREVNRSPLIRPTAVCLRGSRARRGSERCSSPPRGQPWSPPPVEARRQDGAAGHRSADAAGADVAAATEHRKPGTQQNGTTERKVKDQENTKVAARLNMIPPASGYGQARPGQWVVKEVERQAVPKLAAVSQRGPDPAWRWTIAPWSAAYRRGSASDDSSARPTPQREQRPGSVQPSPRWTGQIRPLVDTANPAIFGVPRRELSSTSRRPVLARWRLVQ